MTPASSGTVVSRLLLLLIYQVLASALFLVALPYLVIRSVRHPAEMRERMGWGGSPEGKPLWVHGASLGELQAVTGFLQHSRVDPRDVLVSVLSVSARRQVGTKLPGYRSVQAPLDLWFCLLPFFLRHRPRALVLMETEIWPAWLSAASISKIPAAVVSARISDRSWSRLGPWRPLYRPFCRILAAVGAQTASDAERWRMLGAPEVEVTGNLKYRLPDSSPRTRTGPITDFDSKPDADLITDSYSKADIDLITDSDPNANTDPSADTDLVSDSNPSAAVDLDSDGPAWIFVAGSLRRGEEAVLQSARALLDSSVEVVLAPRHPKEVDHWRRACEAAGVPILLRSQVSSSVDRLAKHGWADAPESHAKAAEVPAIRNAEVKTEARAGSPASAATSLGVAAPASKRALLVDRHGELGSWYSVASAAFVGGTLNGRGGHSLFEPASAGCPTAFGASIESVRDVAEALLEAGAGVVVDNASDLTGWVLQLRRDEDRRRTQSAAARRVARELASSGPRTIRYLSERGFPISSSGHAGLSRDDHRA